jgi:hypothetical protein
VSRRGPCSTGVVVKPSGTGLAGLGGWCSVVLGIGRRGADAYSPPPFVVVGHHLISDCQLLVTTRFVFRFYAFFPSESKYNVGNRGWIAPAMEPP